MQKGPTFGRLDSVSTTLSNLDLSDESESEDFTMDHIVDTSPQLVEIASRPVPDYNAFFVKVCFPEDQFTVIPSYAPPMAQISGMGGVNYTIPFVVEFKDSPILVVGFEHSSYLTSSFYRTEADIDMRKHLRSLYELCQTPRLYGVLFMGSRFCIYTLDKEKDGAFTPEVDPSFCDDFWRYNDLSDVDLVPESRWTLDITTQEGYTKMVDLVNEVKQMSQSQS